MTRSTEKPVLLVVGTRPEGIKMMPVYSALKKAGIPTLLCCTGQHSTLLTQVFDLFNVAPDIDFGITRPGQNLEYITANVLQKTGELLRTVHPALVLVQGDTTSAMAAAMAAFYEGIPVGHVEAGLRTYNLASPFPEEMNRRVIRLFATYHFAPTPQAAAFLLAERVEHTRVFCTGNTVVDALQSIQKCLEQNLMSIEQPIIDLIAYGKKHGKKIMLLTVHRRESFAGGIATVLQTIKKFLQEHPEVVCVYPYHPNPVVVETIKDTALSGVANMKLLEPLAYKELVYLLLHADLVVTDSGGIQEEATSIGKTTLILRENTERMEGVWAGLAQLVGTDETKIMYALTAWLSDEKVSITHHTFFGDGCASERIADIINSELFTPSKYATFQRSSIEKGLMS
jgi:UDP-N-acetylglucosamine 2-epimerase (non-hydrolysing)